MTDTGPGPWDELLDAYAAWSATPAAPAAVGRLSAACEPIGALLDVAPFRVSALLADQIRTGLTRAQAVDALRSTVEDS